MKFKLFRQLIDQNFNKLVSRIVREKKLLVTPASNKRLEELLRISQMIENEGLPKFLSCQKLPHQLGKGIFLKKDTQPLQRNALIAPYAGKVSLVPENLYDDSGYIFSLLSRFCLTQDEQARFDPTRKFHPRRFYSIEIDALKQGNFTRYINHSENPNVYAGCFSIGKNNPFDLTPSPMEIFYIAKRKIYPGEQLLISYEEEEGSYWDPMKVKPFPMDPSTFKSSC